MNHWMKIFIPIKPTFKSTATMFKVPRLAIGSSNFWETSSKLQQWWISKRYEMISESGLYWVLSSPDAVGHWAESETLQDQASEVDLI